MSSYHRYIMSFGQGTTRVQSTFLYSLPNTVTLSEAFYLIVSSGVSLYHDCKGEVQSRDWKRQTLQSKC